MDIETKNAWVARLRTTAAPQIIGSLARPDGGRCALGVLCDVLDVDPHNADAAYKSLEDRGIATGHFWPLNDLYEKSFAEIADLVEEMSLDHWAFCYQVPQPQASSADR